MTLRIDKAASHWTFTLNRPEKLNALSAELVEALIDAFDQAAAAQVPVIALRGEGRCFSAGFDMSEVAQQSDGDLLLRFVRIETLLQRIAALPCLTVAFAHGRNFGAGVDLVAACSLRVAAPDATFRMPGLKFGLVLGTRRFAAIVGTLEARRLLETAATFNVERAVQLGFVERVSEPERWDEIVAEAVQRAAALTPSARARLHDALHDGHEDADLAALVRSAAQPGIGKRIAAYLAP
jgi:enoyl-CoA hydratase/carnithine racemase